MESRNMQVQPGTHFDVYFVSEDVKRPVTEDDSWCYLSDFTDRWGYVVSIPFLPVYNVELQNHGGYIIRCKELDNHLLLQVVPCDNPPRYGIRVRTREIYPEVYRTFRNVNNLHKSNGKWW